MAVDDIPSQDEFPGLKNLMATFQEMNNNEEKGKIERKITNIIIESWSKRIINVF